jgi:hypothetical protein
MSKAGNGTGNSQGCRSNMISGTMTNAGASNKRAHSVESVKPLANAPHTTLPRSQQAATPIPTKPTRANPLVANLPKPPEVPGPKSSRAASKDHVETGGGLVSQRPLQRGREKVTVTVESKPDVGVARAALPLSARHVGGKGQVQGQGQIPVPIQPPTATHRGAHISPHLGKDAKAELRTGPGKVPNILAIDIQSLNDSLQKRVAANGKTGKDGKPAGPPSSHSQQASYANGKKFKSDYLNSLHSKQPGGREPLTTQPDHVPGLSAMIPSSAKDELATSPADDGAGATFGCSRSVVSVDGVPKSKATLGIGLGLGLGLTAPQEHPAAIQHTGSVREIKKSIALPRNPATQADKK